MNEMNNGSSLRKAAYNNGINYQTLHNRINNKHTKCNGRPAKLEENIESFLVEILAALSDVGYSLSQYEVLGVVNKHLKDNNKQHLFPENGPTNEWYKSFMNRHKDKLNRKNSNSMPVNRAMAMNPTFFDHWFGLLKKIMDDHGLHNKPTHVFNCDESRFQFSTGSCVVVTRKGGQAFRLASSNDKNMTTILACISADGRHMPMHTVYKGRRKQHSWLQGGPTGATYDCSESGWMEANNFYKWFAEVFVPSVQHLDGTKLLLFDGHSSHVSLELIDKARENNIVLLKLIKLYV